MNTHLWLAQKLAQKAQLVVAKGEKLIKETEVVIRDMELELREMKEHREPIAARRISPVHGKAEGIVPEAVAGR